MAGDWIKMRCDLHTHPKVVRIASACNADILRTVGGLHAVWCLFDVHSTDGQIDGFGCDTLDTLIHFDGFSNAMASVGWIEVTDKGLRCPRFNEHNSKSAKRRAMNAEMKRRTRTASAKCPQNVRKSDDGLLTREEKRREEISTSKEVDMGDSKKTSRRFVKPTLNELVAYIATRPTKIDPHKFLAHYESNGWRVGKNPMRSWQAAVRTWEGNSFDTGGGKAGPVDKGGYEPAPAMSEEQAGGVKW